MTRKQLHPDDLLVSWCERDCTSKSEKALYIASDIAAYELATLHSKLTKLRANLDATEFPDETNKIDKAISDIELRSYDAVRNLLTAYRDFKGSDAYELLTYSSLLTAHQVARTLGSYHHREQSGKGGKKNKRRVWAERVAERVSRWEELPGPDAPIEFEDLLVCVYRDGDTLCAADIDNMDAEPKKLARSTFEKRYLKK